jgi:hypothetical protein
MENTMTDQNERDRAIGDRNDDGPVLYVSAGQLGEVTDRADEGGTYLPVRKTPKGNFTMPLYAALPSDPVRQVAVRPLKWVDAPAGRYLLETVIADSIVGQYAVSTANDAVYFNNALIGSGGIGMAETHYTSGILSVLIPQAPQPDADGSMTPEEIRLEELKQMAAYDGAIVSFDVSEPFYLASCDHCGWVGSSEHCGTDSFGDDSDVYCPRCSSRGCDMGRIAAALASQAREPDPDCPVCEAPLNPHDICAIDIELGICHAACLEGSPTVDLNTGEPVSGPIPTFRYDEAEGEAHG